MPKETKLRSRWGCAIEADEIADRWIAARSGSHLMPAAAVRWLVRTALSPETVRPMVAPLGPRGDVSPELARDIAICFADYPDEAGQLWTHTRGELTGRLSTSTEKARRFARRCHLEANLLRSKKPPTADDIATKLEKQIGGNRKSAVEEGIKRERKSYIRKAPLRAPHDPAP